MVRAQVTRNAQVIECPSITYIVDISTKQDAKDEIALIGINIVWIVGAAALTIQL